MNKIIIDYDAYCKLTMEYLDSVAQELSDECVMSIVDGKLALDEFMVWFRDPTGKHEIPMYHYAIDLNGYVWTSFYGVTKNDWYDFWFRCEIDDGHLVFNCDKDVNKKKHIAAASDIGMMLFLVLQGKMLSQTTHHIHIGQKRTRSGECYVKHASQTPIRIGDKVVAHYESDGEPRTYERHTESWCVRGHYRHYKSGKVAFIPPHIKGAGKPKCAVFHVNGGVI